MKKTLLKMELVFLCLFLLFFLCVQTSISEYQYGGQITSSDMSLQLPANIQETSLPPAFMECTSLGVQTIGNSYTIRDTALNVIKAEHGTMLGFVDLKTLAEQFTSGVNIESAGNIVPAADPAALPAKAEAQVVANATILVDTVNKGRSPIMFQFGVEAAQLGLTAASEKSLVPIAAVDNNGLVRTEGIQQEPEPAVIVQSSNLPKTERSVNPAQNSWHFFPDHWAAIMLQLIQYHIQNLVLDFGFCLSIIYRRYEEFYMLFLTRRDLLQFRD
jgi:hypothetical protein